MRFTFIIALKTVARSPMPCSWSELTAYTRAFAAFVLVVPDILCFVDFETQMGFGEDLGSLEAL